MLNAQQAEVAATFQATGDVLANEGGDSAVVSDEAPAAAPGATLTDQQAEVAAAFQSSSPEFRRRGGEASGDSVVALEKPAAAPSAPASSSAAGQEVRQLPTSAEYLPTDEQIADMEFLALASGGSNNNEALVQAIDRGQYVNVADVRGNTIMHMILERGDGQVGRTSGRISRRPTLP